MAHSAEFHFRHSRYSGFTLYIEWLYLLGAHNIGKGMSEFKQGLIRIVTEEKGEKGVVRSSS